MGRATLVVMLKSADVGELDDVTEFYRIADDHGNATDWIEENPLDFSVGSEWREEFEVLCNALKAKLDADPQHCCEPCLVNPPPSFCPCLTCP